MFKSKLKLVGALVLSTAMVSVANADSADEDRFYVGMDVMHNSASLGSKAEEINRGVNFVGFTVDAFKKKSASAGLFLGKRFGNWGTELGYTNFRAVEYTIANNKGKIDNYNFYLDGNYFHGVSDSVELIGSAGFGRLTTTTSGFFQQFGYENSSKLGMRLGAGAQIKGESWALRAMYRFQKGNEYMKNISSVGMGVSYHL